MKRSPESQWRLKCWLAGSIVVLTLFFWVLSFYAPVGVGFGRLRRSAAPGGTVVLNNTTCANVELSLARGGLMLVLNGTRTDVVYYDQNMGCSSSDYGLLYTVKMDQVAAPIVWWPSSTIPKDWTGSAQNWAGRYTLVPFWVLLIIGAAAMLWVWRRRPRPDGSCKSCGYNRHGIPPTAKCPECGLVTGTVQPVLTPP